MGSENSSPFLQCDTETLGLHKESSFLCMKIRTDTQETFKMEVINTHRSNLQENKYDMFLGNTCLCFYIFYILNTYM